jgi:hypothetical protein
MRNSLSAIDERVAVFSSVGGAATRFTAERLLHWIGCTCTPGIANLGQVNGNTVFVVLTSERETWHRETEFGLRAASSRFVASRSLPKEVRDPMAIRILIADDQSLLSRSVADLVRDSEEYWVTTSRQQQTRISHHTQQKRSFILNR